MFFLLKYKYHVLSMDEISDGEYIGAGRNIFVKFVLDMIQTYFPKVILKFSDISFSKAPHCVSPLGGQCGCFT